MFVIFYVYRILNKSWEKTEFKVLLDVIPKMCGVEEVIIL